MEPTYLTRAVLVPLDPTPAQEELLLSYCGAARKAHNWVVDQVKMNLDTRREESEHGVAQQNLTPSFSWSYNSLSPAWNRANAEVAPWHNDVCYHAFISGITSAARALENFSHSKDGTRKGHLVGFVKHKSRNRSKLSITFTDVGQQISWLHDDRHHVRLALPRCPSDPRISRRTEQLRWIHTTESTRRLYGLVNTGRARIQKLTIAFVGGRWRASFLVRYLERPAIKQVKLRGSVIGIDLGVKHLATLSVPVKGVTDVHGHVENPRHLDHRLAQLSKLDRKLSRATKGSKNQKNNQSSAETLRQDILDSETTP